MEGGLDIGYHRILKPLVPCPSCKTSIFAKVRLKLYCHKCTIITILCLGGCGVVQPAAATGSRNYTITTEAGKQNYCVQRVAGLFGGFLRTSVGKNIYE